MTRSRPTHKDAPEMIPVIDTLKQALGNNLIAVVLFGSQARDEADESSDWDLLVIARHLPEKPFQRHLYLKEVLPDTWRGQVAMLAKTPEEFEAYLPSLFLDIALDGIVLYDSDGYIADRLLRLQRLIQVEGLQREQIGDEFVWRWQKSPGLNWSLEWETIL
jgi:predicted nucleotidyltransferase